MDSWFVIRMRMDLQLIRLLGAAIVMIAVYAMPSAALAHQNHEAAPVSMTASDKATASDDRSEETSSLPAEAVELASQQDAAEIAVQCPCCSGGSSCCAPAISNTSHNVDLPPVGHLRALAPNPVFGGVDPNGFRRPPRTFA